MRMMMVCATARTTAPTPLPATTMMPMRRSASKKTSAASAAEAELRKATDCDGNQPDAIDVYGGDCTLDADDDDRRVLPIHRHHDNYSNAILHGCPVSSWTGRNVCDSTTAIRQCQRGVRICRRLLPSAYLRSCADLCADPRLCYLDIITACLYDPWSVDNPIAPMWTDLRAIRTPSACNYESLCAGMPDAGFVWCVWR